VDAFLDGSEADFTLHQFIDDVNHLSQAAPETCRGGTRVPTTFLVTSRSSLSFVSAPRPRNLSPFSAESPDNPPLRSGGAHRTLFGLRCCANVRFYNSFFHPPRDDIVRPKRQKKERRRCQEILIIFSIRSRSHRS
jgi:hypothetical protein